MTRPNIRLEHGPCGPSLEPVWHPTELDDAREDFDEETAARDYWERRREEQQLREDE